MKIEKTQIKIQDLVGGYIDSEENGVFGYSGNLIIRPEFQREFIYKDAQRDAVIDTVMKGFPLNTMYWCTRDDGKYEVLDGQQRTISICRYVTGGFSVNVGGVPKFFHNLDESEKKKIMEYELDVYICSGTHSEKLDWFKTINIAGEVLTTQELLNATYAGAWLTNAKTYFSKRACVASKISDGYVKGNPIRQEYLEKALKWIADRDGFKSVQMYMASHQKDKDADELWQYFQTVISWSKMLFPKIRKGVTDSQDWGILYNKYHNGKYNTNELEETMKRLIDDDDVTKKSGIIQYVLTDRTSFDEKYLSIRTFTPSQKLRAWEKQNHKCPLCQKNGIDVEYTIEEMQGDHIVPWSKGGRTIDENLQMLCTKCNAQKNNS